VYHPDSGSWPQNATIVGDSLSAHNQAFSPFSLTAQRSLSAPGSNSGGHRGQVLPPLSSIAARHGAGIIPALGGSSAQQLPNVSSFGIPSMLPPPSQLLLSHGPVPPPPGELGKSDGVSPFEYRSDYAFRQQVPQGSTVAVAAQAPHLGRPRAATGIPPSSSDLISPAVGNPPSTASIGSNISAGTGGRPGGKRGGGSSGLVNGGRVSGNPPAGVTHCAFCGTTTSPEWRKGVTGIKNLCNA
jgi:hypothetical protein